MALERAFRVILRREPRYFVVENLAPGSKDKMIYILNVQPVIPIRSLTIGT
jgi:hypothetical protein